MTEEAKISAQSTLDEGRVSLIIHNSILQLLGLFYEDERVDDATIMSSLLQAAATLAYEAISRTDGTLSKDYFMRAFEKAIEIAEFNSVATKQPEGERGEA